jgi:hypothetical protein
MFDIRPPFNVKEIREHIGRFVMSKMKIENKFFRDQTGK